jgi:hypothetical protein
MRLSFEPNLGPLDRAARAAAGSALVWVSAALAPGWSWAAAGCGAFLLFEAAAGY